MDTRAARDWLEEVSTLFRPEFVITGRCVVVGLAMLEAKARRPLLAEGFLAVLAQEDQDGYPAVKARLTPEALEKLDRLLHLSGSAETLSDAPAKEDRLGRQVFAQVLADRIRRLRKLEDNSPLVIHLDGPWGSGKSTVLNFLKDELNTGYDKVGSGQEAWLVLRYNAWQQQSLNSPWWTVSTLVAVEGARELRTEHAPLRAAAIGLRHFWFRTFAGRVPVLLAAFAAIAVGLLFLPGPKSGMAEKGGAAVASSITTLKDILSVASVVFGVVLAGSRFVAGADASAQEFLRSRPDPMGALVRHLKKLLKLIKRPVAVLVDDIDRCDSDTVVRLLEGVHTVFGELKIVFVIAGDGRWIARAFEKSYVDAAPRGAYADAASGRPLGILFLEKIFQFSAPLPEMPQAFKTQFWLSLLQTSPAYPAADSSQAHSQMRALHTEEDILKAVGAIDPRNDPAQAQVVREAAMRLLAQEDLILRPSRHVLELFETVVEANPRAMKRQIMAYGMARACDLARAAKWNANRALARTAIGACAL